MPIDRPIVMRNLTANLARVSTFTFAKTSTDRDHYSASTLIAIRDLQCQTIPLLRFLLPRLVIDLETSHGGPYRHSNLPWHPHPLSHLHFEEQLLDELRFQDRFLHKKRAN